MNGYFETVGIVLGYRPHRETDRVYRVLTPAGGKMELLARGSRKVTSKLAGALEPVGVVALHGVAGRAYAHVTSAVRMEPFPKATRDPAARVFALTLLGFVDSILRLDAADRLLFPLVREALAAAEDLTDRASRLALRDRFVWKCASVLGVFPSFAACSSCGRPSSSEVMGVWGMPTDGSGLWCPRCVSAGDAFQLSLDAVRWVRAVVDLPMRCLPPVLSLATNQEQVRAAVAATLFVQLGAFGNVDMLARLFADTRQPPLVHRERVVA